MSGSIQVGFVSHVLVEFDCLLLRELLLRVSGSVDLAWVSLWVEVAGSEGSLIRWVLGVVGRMSIWHSSRAKSSRS